MTVRKQKTLICFGKIMRDRNSFVINFNSKEINNERRNNKMENNNNNELVLVESKSMRDQMVSNVTDERMNEVLNK